MIVRTKEGYKVESETTHRSFGTYPTLKKAKKRLRTIEYFKNVGGK